MPDFPQLLRDRPFVRYGLAAATVALAAVVRLALDPVLGDQFPFVTFLAAVLITAWAAGFRPALAAAALGGLAADFLFLPPRYSFGIAAGHDRAALAVYAVVAAAVVVFGRAMQRATERAEAERRRVEREAAGRKKAEALLDRYRLLAEHTRDIVLFVRTDGRIVEANAAAAAAYGYDRDALLTMTIADLRTPDTVSTVPGQIAAADAGGVAFETTHRRRDGGTFPVEVSSLGADVGGERLLLSIVRDVTDRRRAVDALRESEARFRALMEQSPLSTQVFDPDGRTLRVNRAWEELWGVTLDQIADYNVLRDPQLEAKGVMPYIRRGFAGEATAVPAIEYDPNVTIPDRTRHADPRRWVGAVIYPLKDDRGAVREVVLIHEDITARVRAEEALRESQRFIERVARTSPAVLFVHDLVERRNVYANRDVGEELGYPPGASGGADPTFIARVLHPDDPPLGEDRRIDGLADGEVIAVEYRMRHADGSWRWRSAHLTVFARHPDGRPRQLLGMSQDVTEQRAARERLARDAKLLASVRDAIIVTDPAGRVTYWNDGAARLFGWSAAEMIGRPLTDRFPPPARAGVADSIREILAGRDWAGEFEDYRKDGSRVWIDARVVRITDPTGSPVGVMGVSRDISEQKRLEAELRDRAEKLAEADRRKDEFLATLAHELRNPLAPIRNALKILQLAGSDPRHLEAARGLMERQVGQMVRLIDDLLDVSRITRNRVVLRRGPVPLAEVVELALEHARSALDAAGHTLTVSLPPDPLVLDADSARVVQVLANLLNNAAKYTPPGGRVTLSADRDDGWAVVTVRDTGIGIPPADVGRIFEPFTQAGRVPGRLPDGLGIGLSLVKSLVELHGGSVSAFSGGPGTGSTFTVRLPLAATPADSVTRTPPPVARPTARRVLVVDDLKDSGESLGALLRLYGMEVCVAHDGQSALEAAGSFRPDVALVDLAMPGMDGLELARRLRRDPGAPALVAVTGFGQDEDRRRTAEAGFAAHLVKPVDPDELKRVLAELA